uniref:SHSP domain-containing protein n=1 Tax=Oryza barthii TaxID=65489 RepID=A0A0D3FR22_9ORYZ
MFDNVTLGFPVALWRSPATGKVRICFGTSWMMTNEVKIRFNMLGLSREDVKVMVEDNMLVIRGEHSKEDGEGTGGSDDGWWKECSMSSYNMWLALPNVGDKSKVRAELKNGVLFVIVPKTEVKHKVIEGAEQRGEGSEEDGRKKVEDIKGRRWMKNVTAVA